MSGQNKKRRVSIQIARERLNKKGNDSEAIYWSTQVMLSGMMWNTIVGIMKIRVH